MPDVEIRKGVGFTGLLPWAVPEVDPQAVYAIFFDEATGNFISIHQLNKVPGIGSPPTLPTISGEQMQTWTNAAASVATTARTGMIVMTSQSPTPEHKLHQHLDAVQSTRQRRRMLRGQQRLHVRQLGLDPNGPRWRCRHRDPAQAQERGLLQHVHCLPERVLPAGRLRPQVHGRHRLRPAGGNQSDPGPNVCPRDTPGARLPVRDGMEHQPAALDPPDCNDSAYRRRLRPEWLRPRLENRNQSRRFDVGVVHPARRWSRPRSDARNRRRSSRRPRRSRRSSSTMTAAQDGRELLVHRRRWRSNSVQRQRHEHRHVQRQRQRFAEVPVAGYATTLQRRLQQGSGTVTPARSRTTTSAREHCSSPRS